MQESQESNTVCFFFLTIPPLFCLFVGEHIWRGELSLASSLSFSCLYYFSLKLPSCQHLFDTDVVQTLFYFIQKFLQSYSHSIAPLTPTETC